MGKRRHIAALVVLAGYAALCTGSSLALHILAEGPDHEYDPNDCPVCDQLVRGSVAEEANEPAFTCAPENVYPNPSNDTDQASPLQSISLECAGPRAPPHH